MSEELKLFLSNLAVASGVGLAVGAIVGCAVTPLLKWWSDRKVAGRGQSAGARHAAVAAAAAPLPGAAFGGSEEDEPSVYVDDEIAATARKVIGEIAG